MERLDSEVLLTCRQWLSAGFQVHLFTVKQTWGSAPRPVGALLAIRSDGQVKGSVSGGCIEDDLITRVLNNRTDTSPVQLLRYGVTQQEANRFGLPCGGQLELIAETLTGECDWLSDLLTRLANGDLVKRTTHLDTGQVTLTAAKPGDAPCATRDTFNSIHGPQWRMFIVGAGQISEYLAPMALAVGFSVHVCDPRDAYQSGWTIPDTQLLTCMPDDALQAFKPDRRTAIVTLTHDPKLDDLALLDALPCDAFYVGALGSIRHQQKRRERLQTHFGLTDEQFSRLHGPVGIPIGSRTPPEIAVSIMAQIIAEKNRSQSMSVKDATLQPRNDCSVDVS